MTKYGPSSLTVDYDNSGGTPVDITPHVLTINDVDVEEITEETHPFGTSWEESIGVGVGRMPIIELSGLYDDVVTTGPDALFANRVPEGPAVSPATRTLTITWGGTKTTSVETKLVGYRRTGDRGALHKYTVRLQPTGVVTEV